MSFYTSLKKTKDKVEYLLDNYPRLRDSDNRLIANIWLIEMKDKSITAMEFLECLADNRHTDSGSIKRCRRKLQEQNVYLRGKNYKYKKVESEQMRLNIHKL